MVLPLKSTMCAWFSQFRSIRGPLARGKLSCGGCREPTPKKVWMEARRYGLGYAGKIPLTIAKPCRALKRWIFLARSVQVQLRQSTYSANSRAARTQGWLAPILYEPSQEERILSPLGTLTSARVFSWFHAFFRSLTLQSRLPK